MKFLTKFILISLIVFSITLGNHYSMVASASDADIADINGSKDNDVIY